MRDDLGEMGTGEWMVVALGGGFGLLWSLLSLPVAYWWPGAWNPPLWESVVRVVLFWPVFAAIVVGERLPPNDTDADFLALMAFIGAATGALAAFALVLSLVHRGY